MRVRENLLMAEPSDFDAFFQAQYRSVTGLAYVLCGDMGRAEDLTQEAFAAAHRSWLKIDGLNSREVARVLECGEATVKTHLHRAKATLAARLGLDHEAEDG